MSRGSYLSCFKAYSNILILRTRSFFRFSWPFLSPCRNAIRAWKDAEQKQMFQKQKYCVKKTTESLPEKPNPPGSSLYDRFLIDMGVTL